MWAGRLPVHAHDKLRALVAGGVYASQAEAVAAAVAALPEVSGAGAVAEQPAPARFWLLSISHRHGEDYTLDCTQEGAWRALEAYCDQSWAETGLSDEEQPEDRRAFIRAYFEEMEDESFTIAEIPLEDYARLGGTWKKAPPASPAE